jgi:tetratricopeptide (TPR) repeat protein
MSPSRTVFASHTLARDFVGRQAVIERLTGLCFSIVKEGAPWGICVTGEPGSGKSALLGELLHRVEEKGALVLAHGAGTDPKASSVDAMLRRWIEELGSALGLGEMGLTENIEAEALDAAFASLLGRMALKRRVVVLIDALDQFKKISRARFASCLPRPWPVNARLVAMAVAGGASKVLTERPGVEALALPALDAREAREIVEGGAGHQRKLDPQVVDALLAKRHAGEPAFGNPLWLVLAAEELNLLEDDDVSRAQGQYAGTPAERLRDLMFDAVEAMPGDSLRLYRATFDRAAEQFGAPAAQAFLGLTAVSRAGWRESDFKQLLPRASGDSWDERRFAALLRRFAGQMSQRGDLGQWDSNHTQMRAAAHSRLSALSLTEPQLHLLIADYLLTVASDDPLRISETMFHLLGSKDESRAARYYGDASLSEAEVQGATRVLADAVISPPTGSPGSAARDITRWLDTSDNSICAHLAARFLFNLDAELERHGPLESRLIVLESTKRAFERLLRSEPDNTGWQRDLSASFEGIGDVRVAQRDLPEALKSFREGLAIRERLAGAEPGNADWQRDLAATYEKIGAALEAQRNLPEALKALREGLAVRDRLAGTDPDNDDWQHELSTLHDRIGEVLMAQGDLPEALNSFRNALAITKGLVRNDPDNTTWQRDLSVSHDRIGDVLMAQADLPGALESFRDGLAIRERLARADPDNIGWQRGLSVSHDRVADVLVAQGNLPEALQSLRDQLAITERLAASDPEHAAWQRDLSVSHDRIGDVLVAQGKLTEALKAFKDGLFVRDRLARFDPDNSDWQRGLAISYDRVGDVQMTQGDLEGALKSFRDQLAIAERLARAEPGNTGLQRDLSVSYEKVGDVLEEQGKLPEALESFRNGLAIRERLARADPGNVGWQRGLSVSYDCIGDVLVAQGNLPEALKAFRDGRAIRDRLARSDPGNAGWQRDLSVSYDRIGEVLEAQGKLPEALKSFHEGLAITERLARSDPANADWQRGLAVSNAHLADVYRRSDDRDKALAALRQGQSVMKKVVKLSPDNAGWKKDLGWFNEQIESLTK